MADGRRPRDGICAARALGIPYSFLDAPETVKKRIRHAHTLAESSLEPVALLLARDLMWEE